MTDYLKFTRINPKFPIYKSNGYGRDSYIYNDCGGFYHKHNFSHHYKEFFGKLRYYDYDPIVNERLVKSKYDYQRYVKMFRTPQEIGNAIQLRTRQRATSARLSTPKYQRRKFVDSGFRDKYS